MSISRSLRIGDRIQFVKIPNEWSKPGFKIQKSDIQFMELLIKRKRKFAIKNIDEYGTSWISFRIQINGKLEEHSWGIIEKTGWVKS
jgi:hypothetical protein